MPNSLIPADILTKLKLTPDAIGRGRAKFLTNLQIAQRLAVDVRQLTTIPELSPGRPRSGDSHLTISSSIGVYTEKLATNNLALFSSKYPSLGSPSVTVNFPLLSQTKPHLVQFTVALFNKSLNYRFRVFQFPTNTFQDITVDGKTTVITALIPPLPQDIGLDFEFVRLAARLEQRNSQSEEGGWAFYSVKINSVS